MEKIIPSSSEHFSFSMPIVLLLFSAEFCAQSSSKDSQTKKLPVFPPFSIALRKTTFGIQLYSGALYAMLLRKTEDWNHLCLYLSLSSLIRLRLFNRYFTDATGGYISLWSFWSEERGLFRYCGKFWIHLQRINCCYQNALFSNLMFKLLEETVNRTVHESY